MPRRILNRSFWVKYRGEIGYIIGMVGVTIALIGQHQNTDAIKEQSQLGAQAHVALCVLKDERIRSVAQSEAFLRMTLEQRIHRFGEALGTVPASAIRTSLRAERITVESLASLNCP